MTLREDLTKLTNNGGWEHWRFGEPGSPAVGEVFFHRWPERHPWPSYADVLVLFPGRRLFADVWRAPITEGVEVFAPKVIDWTYGGKPSDALTKVLALPDPYSSAGPHWGQGFPSARVPLPWLEGEYYQVLAGGQLPVPRHPRRHDPPAAQPKEPR